MKTIYIVRHGETQWNLECRVQGHQDSPLTEKGIKQAKDLSRSFAINGVNFDCVYSSPSERALKTANIIVGETNVSIQKRDELKEISFGEWEGKNNQEIKKHNPVELHNFWNRPGKYEPGSFQGESFVQLQKRAVKIFNDIMKTASSSNILIVSHGAFIRTLLVSLSGESISRIWERNIHNCSCTVVENDNVKGVGMIKPFVTETVLC